MANFIGNQAEFGIRSFVKNVSDYVKERAEKDIKKVKRTARKVGEKATEGVKQSGKVTGEYLADNFATPVQKSATRRVIVNALKDPVVLGGAGALGLAAIGGAGTVYGAGRAVANKTRPKSKAEKRRKYINEKVDKVLNSFSQQHRHVANFAKKKDKNKKTYYIAGTTGVVGLGGLGAAARYGGRELSYRKAQQGVRDELGRTIKKAVDQKGLSINDLTDSAKRLKNNSQKVMKGGGKRLFQQDIKYLKKLLKRR